VGQVCGGTLWKDADSDIPVLKEAKAEYAKLLVPDAVVACCSHSFLAQTGSSINASQRFWVSTKETLLELAR
jgi:hypothetical protein